MQAAQMMQNPMPQETVSYVETRTLHLSTRGDQCHLLNGDMKSRVMFDIKTFLDFQGDESIQVATISMPYAILTNSNYQLNYTNSRLDFTHGTTSASVSFPYGNYAVDTFMQQFLVSMPSGFGITFNSVRGTFTVTNSAEPFTLLGTSSIDYVMGFSGDVSSSVVGAGHSATLPRPANFLPTPLFRICVESNSIYNGQVLGKDGAPAYSNVLASIPNVSKQNSQVVYQNFSDEFAFSSGQTQLIISILSDDGSFIDFNGVSSYFQLRIRLYKKVAKMNKSFNQLMTSAAEARRALEASEAVIEKPLDRFFGPVVDQVNTHL